MGEVIEHRVIRIYTAGRWDTGKASHCIHAGVRRGREGIARLNIENRAKTLNIVEVTGREWNRIWTHLVIWLNVWKI